MNTLNNRSSNPLLMVSRIKKLLQRYGIKGSFSFIWHYYIAWPAPLERYRGFAKVPVHGHTFKFTTRTNHLFRFLHIVFDELREGQREPGVIYFISQRLRPGDVFLDIGAWIGIYSLLASRLVGPSGQVYAFEPDPIARSNLEENVRLNEAWNVKIVPLGLSDFEGEAIFGGVGFGDSQIDPQSTVKPFRAPVTTLDKFCSRNHISPSLVKIDVEGHEDAVLRGGKDTLSNPGTDVILEFHEQKLANKGVNPDSVWRSLFALGKTVFSLDEDWESARSSAIALSPHSRIRGTTSHLLLTLHTEGGIK